MDMTEGIIARFRTMAIFCPSVLTGHVVGSMIQSMLSVVVVVGVALLVGFRPSATPIEWLAATGVIAAIALALTWLTVALGLVSKTVESASNLPMPLVLLPFFGSGFRAHGIDAHRTAPVRRIPALHPRHRDAPRVAGTPIGNSAVLAVACCTLVSLFGHLWAVRLFNREPGR
jgi:ABC-2 type transport system permease protein